VDEIRDDLLQRSPAMPQARLGCGGVVRLARRSQDGGLRLERIDPVEGFDQRENDVAVMDGGGDRGGKGLAKGGEQLLVS
jgi:hypothetical protein